jgi:hypothetical protein
MNARLLALLAALLLMVLPSAAAAQLQVSHSPSTAPVLGTTIRGVSTTTFTITVAGAVTRASGDAIRLSSASVTPPTITISCGLLNISSLCALRSIRVTIVPIIGSGPARIVKLRVGSMSGASYVGSAPAESASISFDLQPLGLFGTATFKLGMDVQLAAGAASGVKVYDYQVTAQFL